MHAGFTALANDEPHRLHRKAAVEVTHDAGAPAHPVGEVIEACGEIGGAVAHGEATVIDGDDALERWRLAVRPLTLASVAGKG